MTSYRIMFRTEDNVSKCEVTWTSVAAVERLSKIAVQYGEAWLEQHHQGRCVYEARLTRHDVYLGCHTPH